MLFFGFFLGVCFVLFFRDRFFAELQALRRCLRPTANRRAPGCRRWKPLQYWYRKTIYTDVMVACGDAGQDDTSQVCYVNNDSPFPFTGTVQIDAVDFATGTATSVASKKCVWVRHRFGPFLAPLSSALQPPPSTPPHDDSSLLGSTECPCSLGAHWCVHWWGIPDDVMCPTRVLQAHTPRRRWRHRVLHHRRLELRRGQGDLVWALSTSKLFLFFWTPFPTHFPRRHAALPSPPCACLTFSTPSSGQNRCPTTPSLNHGGILVPGSC